MGAPEYDTISENGLLSRNEPIRSKVSKLTEKLRKRYPTTNIGQCAFSSTRFTQLILKASVTLVMQAMQLYSIYTFSLLHITFILCLSVSKGNCYSCNAAFSVLKKRVRITTCYIW